MVAVHVLCLEFTSSNLGYLTSAFTSELVIQSLSLVSSKKYTFWECSSCNIFYVFTFG